MSVPEFAAAQAVQRAIEELVRNRSLSPDEKIRSLIALRIVIERTLDEAAE